MRLSKKLLNFVVLCFGLSINLFAEKDQVYVADSEQHIDSVSAQEPIATHRASDFYALQRIEEQEIRLLGVESSSAAAQATLDDHEMRITNNETTLADHEVRITDLESMAGGTSVASDLNDIAIYNTLLPSNVDQILVFNGAVTTDAGNTLTLAPAEQLAAIGATTTVTADTVNGITFANFTNIQNASGSLNIDTNVVVNEVFTVNSSITIQGNLIVNGAVTVASGQTLTVQGDIIFDGQCTYTFVNNGTITATGGITIKNYTNAGGAAVTNNAGASITTTATTCTGIITFSNNIGSTIGVLNTGAGATISSPKNVIFEKNSGANHGVLNTTSALIRSTTGSVYFIHNEGTGGSGIGVENTGGSAKIEATAGSVHFSHNKGEDVAVKNSGATVVIDASEDVIFEKNIGGNHGVLNSTSARIESTGIGGSINFIENVATDAASYGVENSGGTATITTANGEVTFTGNKGDVGGVRNQGVGVLIDAAGTILFEKNSGDDRGVLNAVGAIIQSSVGNIVFDGNYATDVGSLGIENTTSTATIRATTGHVIFKNNSALFTAVHNNSSAIIESPYNLVFEHNTSRDDAAVANDNAGIIRATGANSTIYFAHNIGGSYGVRNHASSIGPSEIRTTDATAFPNNKTKIIFVGNSGSITDTINNSEVAVANIIAGAATGVVGNGMICYDSQRNVDIASGDVSPRAVICAKDEDLQNPIIDTINVDSTLHKTIVFDTTVTMDSTGGGTLQLGTGNELTVLALLTDMAGIQTVVAVDNATINPASYPTLNITTGASNIFDADIIVNDNFTVNEDLTITGNLTIKGGSLTVATGKTLTVEGDLIAHGLDMDRQVAIVGTGMISARNITLRNYQSSSMEGVRIEGTLTSTKCGTITIHDNSSSAATRDGVFISGTITADSALIFKNNSSSATGADGVHISNASAISVGGNVQFISNTGKDAGHGVNITGTSNVKSLSNIMIRQNSSDGAGHGFNIVDTAMVNGFNIIVENNDSASGYEINIASTATLHACDTILIDHDVIVSDDISGIITGHVVINGSLTVDEPLTIRGDLTVCDKDVTIDNVLTLHGDAIFDGQNQNAQFAITGSGQLVARNVKIQHYTPTDTDVPVAIAGIINVQHGAVQILYNDATSSSDTNKTAVDITSHIMASGDILFSHNAGKGTGHGVSFASSQITSESSNVRFVQNSTTGDGDGVNLSGATVVTALQDIIVQDNNSGGTGEGFNVQGTTSITSNGHTHVKDNSSVQVVAAATFDTTNHTLILDKTSGTVTVSSDFDHSGMTTGHVYIKTDFVVDQDLQIDGDLTVKGSVTVNTGTTLTVTGDILFDGESDGSTTDNGVKIEGNVSARDIVIKNYRRATGSDEAIVIQSNTDPVTVTAKGHIIIENNRSTGTATVGAVKLAENTGDVEVSAQGDIRFVQNSTDVSGVVAVVIDIDKPSSLPGLNVGARLSCIGNRGVTIAGGVIFAHDAQFYNNVGNVGDTDAPGMHAVTIAGDITTVDTLTIDSNIGGMGGAATAAGQSGGSGVVITGAVTTHDLIVNFNVGGTGTAGAAGANAGGNAGNGVLITGAGAVVTVKGKALLNSNQGGDAGASTGATIAGKGGDGVSIESLATLETDTGLSVRGNAGGTGGVDDGTGTDGDGGHGCNVASHVTAHEGKLVSDNVGGAAGGAGGTAGVGVNVVTGIRFVHIDTEGRQLFDHDVITSTVLGASVSGDVVVTGDLNIDSDLAITGDLIVRGGSVAFASTAKLTVTGDIIFDGQGNAKNVVIEGDIVGATATDPGAQNVTIKNYDLTSQSNSMSAVTIAATGSIITEHDIEIVNNAGAQGTAAAMGMIGGHGINIIGLVKAKGSIKLHNNVGGIGGQSTDSSNVGGTGGHGVLISSPLTANDTINVISNIGGTGGLSTDATGGLGAAGVYVDSFLRANEVTFKENKGGAGQDGNGINMNGGDGASGVYFAVAADVLAQATTVIANNIGGAGGTATGTGNTGNGGNGAELASAASITADSVISIRNNVGGATDTGGTSGSGFALLTGSTLRALGNKAIFDNAPGAANGGTIGSATILDGTCVTINNTLGKTIYDGDTTTSAIGSPTANVCVNGTLTVDSNETIHGNLEVDGSVVTDGSGRTLVVYGDMTFNGQGTDKTVTIAATDTLSAYNVVIKNYIATTDHAVDISGTVNASHDIIIKDNGTSAATSHAVIITGSMIATSGKILLRNNSSTTDHGVEVSGTGSVEAMSILFNTNFTSELASHGVHIDNATIAAHDDLRFTYNAGGSTSGNGVVVGDVNSTTIMAGSLYVVVTCTSQRQHVMFDTNTIKTDFYCATILELVSNTGTACTVDLVP